MTLIELGSVASALIAVITLINKIVSLIGAIQGLIQRLDQMQLDIEGILAKEEANQRSLLDQEVRLRNQEWQLESLKEDVSTLNHQMKGMMDLAFVE